MKNIVFYFFILFFITTVDSEPAMAGGLRVSPVKVEMTADENNAQVTVFNLSEREESLQVRIFRWQQVNGSDALTETHDVVVSPPFIRLEAGRSFAFRLIRTAPAVVPGEDAFRVLIDELPQPQDARALGRGLNVVIRNSMPLFITAKDAVPHIRVRAFSPDALVLENAGARHALLTDVALTDGAGHRIPVSTTTVNGYLLGHGWRSFSPAKGTRFPPAGARYTLTLKANGLPVTLNL